MASLLPAPVLVIHSSTGLDLSKIQTVLLQLGYQPDMLLYADNMLSAQFMITDHLPNLILYHAATTSEISLIRPLKQQSPDTPVIAIFDTNTTALIYSALLSGADSYMQHQNSFSEFAESLKTVLRGGAYIHTELADYILHQPIAKTCLNLAELQLLKVISQHTLQAERQNQLQMKDYQMYSRVKHIYRKLVRLSLNSSIVCSK
ncbi:DNA-binding response regulator [Acinetobacter lwoffii]|uniref:DNA-binding response regulator n=1 Tax=Acinetobacter lwoffii TaxID=28090 RepID=UPI00209B9334|nr:DNA-binding response regulator [Acinetobacter lwoffii]MCO8080657.1 DNA-binding response regulator [Acinetobacter lwoffii]